MENCFECKKNKGTTFVHIGGIGSILVCDKCKEKILKQMNKKV